MVYQVGFCWYTYFSAIDYIFRMNRHLFLSLSEWSPLEKWLWSTFLLYRRLGKIGASRDPFNSDPWMITLKHKYNYAIQFMLCNLQQHYYMWSRILPPVHVHPDRLAILTCLLEVLLQSHHISCCTAWPFTALVDSSLCGWSLHWIDPLISHGKAFVFVSHPSHFLPSPPVWLMLSG